MTKKNGNQSFSLRRIILQRARINESRQSNRLNDEESAFPKQDHYEKVKKEGNIFNHIPYEQSKLESSEQFADLTGEDDLETFCKICYRKEPSTNAYTLDLCGHKFCVTCLVTYLRIEICESRTNIGCPECTSGVHPNNIEYLLKDFPELKSKYEDFMVRRYLVTDPDSRWCPAPDCSFAVIATGCASCPQLKCERPNCGVSFCYHCKAEWHPDQTCDAARTSRQNVLRTSISFSQGSALRDEIKPCPRCQVLIVKMNDGSCNHMVCSVCGAEFCWLCMKEVSDLHYLSPSGCTFWGKKPWSRKKKIVWQIGTLIGAPVGIALLAGIAIPSMVIGIPVWVGRKLFDRYKTKTRQKRNITVTIGVTASILISPLLAGLAIAVGVPILLFYVYGIVPVSLCRAGCGASTTEEYNFDVNIGDDTNTKFHNDGASADAVSRLGETSIGDVSLSVTSGSLIEGVNNTNYNCRAYRESTVALAGSVTNQKIETADTSSAKSLSATTCNSEKPSNTYSDANSGIALAGSITSNNQV